MKATRVGILCMAVVTAAVFSLSSGENAKKKTLYENDQVLHALLILDENVLENAKVLIHDLVTKGVIHPKTAGMHSSEMLRSLNTSEEYLAGLEKATDLALDAMQLRYLAGLHEHYLKAIEMQKGIDQELARASPERSVIRMKTLYIYSEMKKAEHEQLKLDSASGVKEPEEPVMEK